MLFCLVTPESAETGRLITDSAAAAGCWSFSTIQTLLTHRDDIHTEHPLSERQGHKQATEMTTNQILMLLNVNHSFVPVDRITQTYSNKRNTSVLYESM